MSEERWELEVAATAAENYEAMTTAGRPLLRGKHRAVLIFQSGFIRVNALIGATMLFLILVRAFGGPDFSNLPAFAMPVNYVFFALLTIWLLRQAYLWWRK